MAAAGKVDGVEKCLAPVSRAVTSLQLFLADYFGFGRVLADPVLVAPCKLCSVVVDEVCLGKHTTAKSLGGEGLTFPVHHQFDQGGPFTLTPWGTMRSLFVVKNLATVSLPPKV